MNQLQKAAIKLLKQNIGLRRGEKVVVVSDRKKGSVFEAVCWAVKKLGGDLKKIKITSKRTHSSPLPRLKKVFSQSKVIIGITDKSISHCPETRVARKRYGARVITLVEVDKELFLKGMKVDQKKVREISEKLARKLKKSGWVRIKTSSGADFKVKVVKEAVGVDDGDSTEKGKLNNLPYGEVCMAPIGFAEGVVVIDFSRADIWPRDKVKVILRKGKIIEGNNEKAKRFINYLKGIDGEKALKIVEFAIGTNPGHKKLMGKIIHDEKILGSVHVAFGGFGEERRCKIHEDVVLLKPKVWFDEKLVIKGGKVL